MKPGIIRDTVLVRNPNYLFSDIDGEVVILSINNGEYYSLDSVGSHIWSLLEKPCNVQKLINDLLDIFDVNEETCLNDSQPFLEEFLDKGLIEIIDA